MKKFLLFLVTCLLLFLGLTYWSLAIGPSEIEISRVISPEVNSEEDYRNLELVEVAPTNQYHPNRLKSFMQGVNYRKAWETPVKAQVFFLDSFAIVKEGGGNQTRSLEIKGPDSIVYSLRSINKDPAPLIPRVAKILGLENIIIDGVSAQHPYGALLAASLSEAVGILYTHPRIVFVPEHPALGTFSRAYANRLYLLEYETEGAVNWTSYEHVLKIVETDDLQELKAELGAKLQIDEQMLVKARLFDILIGDWDRHAKQWGWVLQQQENSIRAIPLPGDRDNAFFRIDGVLPTLITNELVQPMVRPFEKDIDHIPGYVYPFDRYFLKSVPEEVFVEEAIRLKNELTDEKIRNAIAQWPAGAARLNGDEIFKKLKHRRDDLPKYAREFSKEIKNSKRDEKPLKGSEDLQLPAPLQKCFQCS
ncbi:hypothetical protein [Salinimicrobium oceani]|uniref:Uncharacterized protein n=1 Tax=Salinimicrobium oceani TaxID=2722702 RepID=A0ABX1CZQ4_9FLAO|nr:hypothetical protein [Salinimicrobium oceani]NJW52592.1 hypothetical protein [Salinimicrobium oceani]